MKKIKILFFTMVLFVIFTSSPLFSYEALLTQLTLSNEAKELLEKNGFVVTKSGEKEIYEIYNSTNDQSQPAFVTTDAVLHTGHVFFDYLLRILEIEVLSDTAKALTDKMLALSIAQYKAAKDPMVKEAALLNIGYFSVPKKIWDPDYTVEYGLDEIVNKEIENIKAHKGFAFRELLRYVENPDFYNTPYAYEDYSQYIPRGHYTRNETFEEYFNVMMWYGRIDFKLKGGSLEGENHGQMMTLQALLMVDALSGDKETLSLWRKIYEPTAYFVGTADDLTVDDYRALSSEIFPSGGSIDRYGKPEALSKFIEEAKKLRPPKILSGAAFVENGKFEDTNKGFRFMGQRFIPDSYIFQQLVFGVKSLEFTGSGKPFTWGIVDSVGPTRTFPRGLDVMSVFGSERASEILDREGDTEYKGYFEQVDILRLEFSTKTEAEWKQNLYWRWLYSLLPLLQQPKGSGVPKFMLSSAWMDKSLATALGSWTELRHDTILYAKQSYTMMGKSILIKKKTYGYVEPYPEVYGRLGEMMGDLRNSLTTLGIAPEGVPEKIAEFEKLLTRLKVISEKELENEKLTEEEYDAISNIGNTLESLADFPKELMNKITSETDTKMDVIADVHTDSNTGQVLEEGVGAPCNIYVLIDDSMGKRVCRGGVFSYYEFKQPMSDRLTDEKWQEMGENNKRPTLPEWTKSFIVE
ncbi:MAG: DUF3160 domain-containing protein [Deltaproteobacteria bacterium]|uniref:DUF3160 domain-containing protein n=1 Tax=Candidatus Zymogenus saltonus TaxID=2844893 RepID=A0A9D8PQ23_9DELT|nr:DUF3160 domain-containing protein [Candidatus Zymogenus saltonus]